MKRAMIENGVAIAIVAATVTEIEAETANAKLSSPKMMSYFQ
jgi:hypothetical protein